MSKREVFDFMTLTAMGLISLGIVTGVLRWVKLDKCQKLLVLLMIIALLIEILSKVLRSYGLPTFPGFHVYALIEYALLAQIYSRVFSNERIRKAIKYSPVPMFFFGVVNVIIWQPISNPNTNVITVSGLIMITLSIAFFFNALSKMRYQRIEKSALFWISIGVLIYFASTIVMFTFLRGLAPMRINDKVDVFVLNVLFNIIHYLCFNIALWMKPE